MKTCIHTDPDVLVKEFHLNVLVSYTLKSKTICNGLPLWIENYSWRFSFHKQARSLSHFYRKIKFQIMESVRSSCK